MNPSFKEKKPPLTIIGAGLSGLAAAVAIAPLGLDVTLYEQSAPHHTAHGAGIQLAPNAIKALAALGAWEAIAPYVDYPDGVLIRDGYSGHILTHVSRPRTLAKRFGAALGVVRRSDLHMGLKSTVLERTRAHLIESAPVEQVFFAQNGHWSTPYARDTKAYGALLGADGVHSLVRRTLHTQAQSLALPQTHWRAVIDLTHIPVHADGHAITLWLLEGAHVVGYAIGRGEAYNLVVTLSHDTIENYGLSPPFFGGSFRGICRALQDVLLCVPQGAWWEKPVFVAPSLPKTWGIGASSLIGDAAHGMLPALAQGAAMGFEDAWTLGAIVHAFLGKRTGTFSFWPQVFRAYETARHKRVSALARASLQQATIYHLGGGLRIARNLALQYGPKSIMMARLSKLYTWKPHRPV